jgi:hypothetical protein
LQLQPVDRFVELVRHRAPIDLPGARIRELGPARDGQPIVAVEVPGTPERAAVLGYPHPAEPLAQLAWDGLTEVIRARLRIGGAGRWLIIPAWDAAGARLADPAWTAASPPLETLAASWVRPAPDLQVEWSFPVELGNQRFDAPLPETAVIQNALDDMAPHFLFSLHNALFPDGYLLVSDEIGACQDALGEALTRTGMGRRHPCPIPYVPEFGAGVYGLPGIQREWEYLTSLSGGTTPSLDHGAASFDSCAASHSCVLELPLLSWRMPDPVITSLAQAEPSLWASLFDLCERLLPGGTPGQDAEAAYLLSSPRYFSARPRPEGTSPAAATARRSLPARELASQVCMNVFTVASNISMLQRGLGLPVEFPAPVRQALAVVNGLVRWRDSQSLTRCLRECLEAVLSMPHPDAKDQ